MNLIFRIIFSAALLAFGVMFLGRSHANATPSVYLVEPNVSTELNINDTKLNTINFTNTAPKKH